MYDAGLDAVEPAAAPRGLTPIAKIHEHKRRRRLPHRGERAEDV